MIIRGKAWKFGDEISTDLICPGRYFHLRSNLSELSQHVLEDADPEFSKNVKAGDLIVAGTNFGLGSSREHAARIIKLAGVGAVLAKSFARIFYRNAINIGLPVIECDTDEISAGDLLEVDLSAGLVFNHTKGSKVRINPLPPVMLKILSDGGLIAHIQRYGDLKLNPDSEKLMKIKKE